MKKFIFTFLAICLTALHILAQKKEYREKFTQGNYLILEQNYPLALEYFKEAYKIDSTNANINYKIGLCLLQSATQKSLALGYLEKAVKSVTHNYDATNPDEKKAPEQAYQLLGEAYRLQYKFNESTYYFNLFKELVGNRNRKLSNRLSNEIEKNQNAIELTKDSLIVTITNLGDSINSPFPDYSPIVSADGSMLIFTSRRPGSTGGEKTYNDEFHDDIYYSVKHENGKWSKAKSIGLKINTNGDDAALSLSADGQQLFIYKDENGGDVFYSTQELDGWSIPQPLTAINTPAWETFASISPDGHTLYFVSDRKGGYGGRDIWRCVMLPNGKWSLPLNLGSTINTEEDEEAPMLHTDGTTLFFSSKGHKGMGGFDIFKSKRQNDNSWSVPENMGAPINTPDDDMFYMQSSDGKKGYFASVRPNGFGNKDIYSVDFYNPFVEPLAVITGYITYNGEKNIPPGAKITAIDIETNTTVQEVKPNNITGKYILILNSGTSNKTYNITYEAEAYQPLTVRIIVPPGAEYAEIERALALKFINLESKTSGTVGITGTVNNEQGELLKDVTITVKDNENGALIGSYFMNIDSANYFYFTLKRGQNYNISYEAKGYLFQSININIPQQPEYETLAKNIVLSPIKPGAQIVLNNIFFDPNKSVLKKESQTEIDKVVELMKEYPALKIQVNGHTDNKGKDVTNLKLSEERAKAVVNAIVQKGISNTRLIAKGFGKTQPIAPNNLPNGKPNEKGMQLNRRVELKIL